MKKIAGLVRKILIKLTTEKSGDGSRKHLQAKTIAATKARQSFRAADRFSRDELHDRHVDS